MSYSMFELLNKGAGILIGGNGRVKEESKYLPSTDYNLV